MEKMLLRLGLATVLAGFSFAALANDLKIGDPAPPIEYAHWIKGNPVRTLEPGKVYVVEFWATWCGPCKMSMPHLTQLAKKFAGKVTFIGVDVRQTEEADASLKTVEDFVKGNSANMGYNVAMDDPDKNTVFDAWMTAAHVHGIPTSFVVDANGKIAWVGHPLFGLEQAITQTLDGSIDANASSANLGKQIDEAKQAAAFKKLIGPIEEAFKAKDYQRALSECDKLANDPVGGPIASSMRFRALLHVDEQQALSQFGAPNGKESAEQADFDRASTISYEDGISPNAYKTAVSVLAKPASAKVQQWMFDEALAKCYGHLHMNQEALDSQDKAIADAKKAKLPAELIDMLTKDRQAIADSKS